MPITAVPRPLRIFESKPQEPVADEAEFAQRTAEMCTYFDKGTYQHFVQYWVTHSAVHRSLLLYHGLGVGKTCSAITIAEALLENRRDKEPKIWVVSSRALLKSFQTQIFSTLGALDLSAAPWMQQCTQDLYLQLIPNAPSLDPSLFQSRLASLLRRRYKFVTYDGFAAAIEALETVAELRQVFRDSCIIVDEAHNLRNDAEGGENATNKRVTDALLRMLDACRQQNNRLILLSATPIYNDPREILELLGLLCMNEDDPALDPRKLPSLIKKSGEWNKTTLSLIGNLASKYVSYIRAENPFTFAVRLSPKELGLPVLTETPPLDLSGKPFSDDARDWVNRVDGGIFPSPLGSHQAKAWKSAPKSTTTTTLLQMDNMVVQVGTSYRVGMDCIDLLAERVDTERPTQWSYRTGNAGAFSPAGRWLRDHASKIANIANLVAKSKGIVVLYSQFVWSGVVPMAMALEHIGLKRWKERDLIAPRDKSTSDFKTTGSYVLLSDDASVRSRHSLRDILIALNSHTNMDGSQIKAVLMTPVASEGLSFKNVREVHLIDPWYHFNRPEQVIGRAIRKCSHLALPLSQRNVTVFYHAAADPEGQKETADLHAYRIAYEKSTRFRELNRLLAERALDCPLFVQRNNAPKSLFNFHSALESSQGIRIMYKYGDREQDLYKCSTKARKLSDAHAPDFEQWVPTLRQMLLRYIRAKATTATDQKATPFTEAELMNAMKVDGHDTDDLKRWALVSTLAPNTFDQWALVPHRDGFWWKDLRSPLQLPKRIVLTAAAPAPEAQKEDADAAAAGWESRLDALPKERPGVAMTMLYPMLDSQNWPSLAKGWVDQTWPDRWNWLKDIFARHGALIGASELDGGAHGGFIDIFAADFRGHVKTAAGWREATAKEIAKVKAGRRADPPPEAATAKHTMGMWVPVKSRAEAAKNAQAPARMVFKIMRTLGPDDKGFKVRGIVCDTVKRPTLTGFLEEIGIQAAPKATLSQMCFFLGEGLAAKDRLWVPPEWKPKK